MITPIIIYSYDVYQSNFFFFLKGPWCTHHGKFIFSHSQMIPYSSTYILNSHIHSLACSHSFCIILLHKYRFQVNIIFHKSGAHTLLLNNVLCAMYSIANIFT